MRDAALHPAACAAFLVAAFTLAGICQTAWLALPVSQRLAIPIDGGRTVRGRRLFGANKTLRGFVVMVPATHTLWRRQFVLGAPRQEPGLHVLMLDVMASLHLAIGPADFRQHSLLVANVRLDRIGNEEVGASTRSLR